MNTNTRTMNFLILTLATMSLLGMVGCTPASGGSSNSNSAIQTSEFITTANGYAVTNCTGATTNTTSGAMTVQLEAYTQSGVLNTNWVRVRITSLPTNVSLSSGSISFWAYNLDTSGNILGETNMPFFIEQYTGSGQFQSFGGNTMNSYTINNTSLASIDFVVELNNNPNVTVLNTAIAASSGGSIQHQVEALIPAIYANPNVYASAHQNSALSALHPFASMTNNGYNDNQYAQLAQSDFCF